MSVTDFVCYVLQVPVNLDGFIYTCKAIKYVLDNNEDPRFYEHLQKELGKSYACIEKGLRLAKSKSLSSIDKTAYKSIYGEKESIKTKEFIWYAAHYYGKEIMKVEDKDV